MFRWTFAEKRNLTLFAFSTRMFFMGVEYAVIFPSVWLYLKIFHVEYWYLGLVLSAYNMVGIVSTALVGHLVDISRKVRFTGFVWNLAEISGNLIYALPFNVSFPLIGRMVAGFGEGFISAMWGELARVTTAEQRTRYFAILKGSNLLGAAVGPAFNLFLKEINFNIGVWTIDLRTSPGFVMTLIWIVVTVLMIFCVFDLSWELQNNPDYQLLIEEPMKELKPPKRKKKRQSSRTATSSPDKDSRSVDRDSLSPEKSASSSGVEAFTNLKQRTQLKPKEEPKRTILAIADEALALKELKPDESLVSKPVETFEQPEDLPVEDTTTTPLPEDNEQPASEPSTPQYFKPQRNPFDSSSDTEGEAEQAIDIEETRATFKDAILDMFTKFHVIVLIYLLFFMYIIHTCLQGISPLISETMLSWSETQVSLLYTGWGLEIILVLVVVWLLAPKVSDRVILLSGVVCGCLSTVGLIILSYSRKGSNLCLYSFIITVLFEGVGISVTVVIARSLVSKHTKAANQGLVHAILTSFNRTAGLSGPIFGSSLFTHIISMAWILATVQVIGLVLLVLAYKKLKVVDKPGSTS